MKYPGKPRHKPELPIVNHWCKSTQVMLNLPKVATYFGGVQSDAFKMIHEVNRPGMAWSLFDVMF